MGLNTVARNEVIVSGVLFLLATVVVVLRFVGNYLLRRTITLSDFFAATSWVLLIGLTAEIVLWAVIGNNGRHMQELDPHQRMLFYLMFYINQINYFVLAPCMKLSIIFFYRSIFSSVRWCRVLSMVIAALISIWGFAIVLAGVLQCTPVQAFWLEPSRRHCVDQQALLYGVQYPNIIFDFILLLLPMPIIWTIQQPTKQKIELLAVFSLGGIGCAAAIVRLITLGLIEKRDVEYTIYHATVWTLVEPCVAFMCASLPIVRGAFHAYRRELHRNAEVKSGSWNKARGSASTGTPCRPSPGDPDLDLDLWDTSDAVSTASVQMVEESHYVEPFRSDKPSESRRNLIPAGL